MTQVQITNGVLKYGRTIKTGDFESKRGDVELSFNVPEGDDVDVALVQVQNVARSHLFTLLGCPEDNVGAKAAPKDDKPKTAAKVEKPKEAAKMPPAAKATDAAEVSDEIPPVIAKQVAAENKKAAEADPMDELSDLLGGAEEAKEITDKMLTDATQKCQSEVKNAPAIRKILTELGIKMPPGRIIDLPQDKRQTYLGKLKEVKPLA